MDDWNWMHLVAMDFYRSAGVDGRMDGRRFLSILIRWWSDSTCILFLFFFFFFFFIFYFFCSLFSLFVDQMAVLSYFNCIPRLMLLKWNEMEWNFGSIYLPNML